jgi:ribosomal protein L7Ae-like RNA K-turn-binding protein
MNSKLTSAIGFAMKAGKLVSGDFSVEKAVRAKRAKIALIDSAASANTQEKYRAMSEHAGIMLAEVEELGQWIGKPGRMVAAVTDEQFTTMIKRAISEQEHAQ